jgi:CDP-diacylglycerol pyrophosphatase
MSLALVYNPNPQSSAIALNINSHTGFTRNLLREHCGKLTVRKSLKQPILVDAYSAKSDL